MIIEFETKLGVVFQIDTEDLTYKRWFLHPETKRKPGHGKLVMLPEGIEVGKHVSLCVREYDNAVHVFSTSEVVSVRQYDLESPEESNPDLSVNPLASTIPDFSLGKRAIL